MTLSSAQVWKCAVCGYVHYGPEAPDCCPVCGASKDWFEPFVEEQKPSPVAAPKQWRCLNCGYIHDGLEPLAYCPVCGATADRFESYTPETAPHQHAGTPQKVI